MLQGKSWRARLAAMAAMAAVLLLAAPGAAAAESGGPPLEGAFGDAFVLQEEPRKAPLTPFQGFDGAQATLADFAGQVVLLNFWATWCAPCIEEMPTLDALQQEMGGQGLRVVAVSEDAGGRDRVEAFLRDRLRLEHLDVFLDPMGDLAAAMGVRGLPTTFLLDARGRVVGGLEGPAQWDAPAVRKLIGYYIARARADGLIKSGG